MSQQTFMKLGDKVHRPKLTIDRIDHNNTSYQRLLNQYIKWFESTGDSRVERDEYMVEIDSMIVMSISEQDGYQLAKHLEETLYICPDESLVGILSNISSTTSSLKAEILKKWVQENFLVIPDDVMGKKVNANQDGRKYQNQYITNINSDNYTVCINNKPTLYGGFIIDFENIEFVTE